MTTVKELAEVMGQGQIFENEPMSRHTTFHIGGPADILACPETEDGLAAGIRWCVQKDIPFYIIGNGSNLLVGDQGFRGVLFKICKTMDWVETELIDKAAPETSGIIVRAGAGIMLAKLAKDISAQGYTGFEFATGIPGTLGGAVAMNAGAYDGEMKQLITSVWVMDMKGNIRELTVEEMAMGYRTSRVQTENLIVLSTAMELKRGSEKEILRYVEELTCKRREKQPLEYPSAGSTFKRPEGYFAGKLIQDAGLKGYRVGDAMVSEKHSGFVINVGCATASQVRQLMADVDRKVYEDFHVHLEPEIRMIGEF
ncbi:UDP-N-acetylmuramate dehydrogenase [Frisingicoccus sp.]|uniref:UDP-N-acetylmuramate dehydrogenase n=1 Tax=Frisingicoccus sp. TaxID=1918627 RepID=UPI002EA3E8F1|nr:UDP-N-acetylmuramate dehydrogenase [Frisingicoccus sp.]